MSDSDVDMASQDAVHNPVDNPDDIPLDNLYTSQATDEEGDVDRATSPNPEEEDISFHRGNFVTYRENDRNNVGDVSMEIVNSMLSQLYVSEDGGAEEDPDEVPIGPSLLDDLKQAFTDQMAALESAISTRMDTVEKTMMSRIDMLERDFRNSLDSAINREQGLRDYMEGRFRELDDNHTASRVQLEKAVYDCFLRRDDHWTKEFNKVKNRATKAPVYSTPAHGLQFNLSQQSPSVLAGFPILQQLVSVPVSSAPSVIPTVTTSDSLATSVSTTIPISTMTSTVLSTPMVSAAPTILSASGSSATVFVKPPVKMDFPKFGERSEDADVINYIEKCENFLALRPLSDVELMATFCTVLGGSARSWWTVEKNKIHTWAEFKTAFLAAFLRTDYLTEIEERVRVTVQTPTQSIRLCI